MNKNIVVLSVFAMILIHSLSFAGEVVVPHTFTPHTTAKADEINENFHALSNAHNALLKKMEGKGTYTLKCGETVLGSAEYLRTSVTTSKGYFYKVTVKDGKIAVYSDWVVFYASDDCTGQVYSQASGSAQDFPQQTRVERIYKLPYAEGLFMDDLSAIVNIDVKSYYMEGSCRPYARPDVDQLYRIVENDPNVTGVPSNVEGLESSTCYWVE